MELHELSTNDEEIARRLNGDRFQLSQDELQNLFPTSVAISCAIRSILERCPDNRERQLALESLDSARTWVEKSIRRGV